MNGKIIRVHAHQQMTPCQVCRRPMPAETVWRGVLCQECWSAASREQGWVSEPMAMAMTLQGRMAYPVRLMMPALLSGVENERGNDTNSVRALARVLWEREMMAAFQREEVSPREGCCCYCGEHPVQNDQGDSNFVVEESQAGLPTVQFCKDFRACDARLAQQIGTLVQRLAATGPVRGN